MTSISSHSCDDTRIIYSQERSRSPLKTETTLRYNNYKNSSFTHITTNGKLIKKGKWTCDICHKSLCSKRSYNDHMNIHKNARPFNCSHCDYSAASKNTLQRHFLRHHQSKEKWSYLCPYCPEMYVEAAGYRNHLKQKHHGCSGTFGCPFGDCKFSTMSAAHFKDHILRHNPSYFDEGSSITTDLSQNSLRLYLIDDNFGSIFLNDSSFVIPIQGDDSSNLYNNINNSKSEEDIGKLEIKIPKFYIKKNNVDGTIIQSIPLPKKILEENVVMLSQPKTTIINKYSRSVSEPLEEMSIMEPNDSIPNNKYQNSNTTSLFSNIKIKPLVENEYTSTISKINKKILTKDDNKKIFKTVEGFIDEDIDDDVSIPSKNRCTDSPKKESQESFITSLQKEKAFKTNDGIYDWELD
uniref:C2H2-type domain-containing protein n=1 Tax=Parastrongyloides trichosuri TaxID=131310 RepID=A0A0N4ZTQ3_PARTI